MPGETLLLFVVGILNPLVAVGLALWIAACRPGEAISFIVCVMLLGFAQLVGPGYEQADGSWHASLALAITRLAVHLSGVAVLCFSLYFPRPLFLNRAVPYALGLWAAATCVVSLRSLLIVEASLQSFTASQKLERWLPTIGLEPQVLPFCALLIGVCGLVFRALREQAPDLRRRLQVFLIGTAVGLGPILTFEAIGLGNVAPWALLCALLLTSLFPISVAYVTTVYRSQSPATLLYEGLRYLLTPRHLGALQFLLSVAAVGLAVFPRVWMEAPSAAMPLVAFGVFLALQLAPVRRLSIWMASRVFARHQQMESGIREFGRLMGDSPGVRELMQGIIQSIERTLAPSNVCAFTPVPEGFAVTEQIGWREAPAGRIDSDSTLIAHLRSAPNPLIVYLNDPVSWTSSLSAGDKLTLSNIQSEVLVPIRSEDGLRCIISVGPKSTPYSRSELALLGMVEASAALVLKNTTVLERITSETASRERLKAERDAADRASKAKSTFLAGMSHELRTPLNAIIGYSELLVEQAEADGSTQILSDLSRIRSAGKHLLELINSILDISKIEAGKMEVYLETFDVRACIEDVINIVKPLAQQNQNELGSSAAQAPGLIRSDRTKFRQMLFNLLSNACKFTKRGRIDLSAWKESDLDGGRNWLVCSVIDTGIGMTEEQIGKVFRPFEQAESSIASKYGGTGLGLSLSRQFAQMLGGTITVSSKLGEGTIFMVRIPEDSVPPSDIPPETPSASAEAPVVLVIDDDAAIHDIFKRSSALRGFHLTFASSGKEGLTRAKQLKPHAIVLDVMMVGLDGLQVLASIKSDPDLSSVPVIMLTVADGRKAGLSLGASEYLVKPVGTEQLVGALARYCPGRVAESSVPLALVVDDDPAGRLLMRRSVENQGWAVTEAANGQEALNILAARLPDLVLLDLLMPVMDGFTFLDEFRTRPDCGSIPVVILTAKEVTPEERIRLSGIATQVVERHSLPTEDVLQQLNQQLQTVTKIGSPNVESSPGRG
jgi:signal transduction histidine kinase/CheY-like chemotaxis protein